MFQSAIFSWLLLILMISTPLYWSKLWGILAKGKNDILFNVKIQAQIMEEIT